MAADREAECPGRASETESIEAKETGRSIEFDKKHEQRGHGDTRSR